MKRWASLVCFCLVQVSALNYCALGRDHTLCMYKVDQYGSACEQIFPVQFSNEDKAKIVEMHNDFRRRIAMGESHMNLPSASNMRALVWDEELATIAQVHVQQCVFDSDANRRVNRFHVGQNIAISLSHTPITKPDWTFAIHSWVEGENNVNISEILSYKPNPDPLKFVKQFTQFVWAKSHRVGCGIVSYHDRTVIAEAAYTYKVLVACNYGPGGNTLKAPVYVPGKPCSKCPKGTVCDDGLCVAEEKNDAESLGHTEL